MQIKSFNTGRAYTAEGQRISYTITESGFLIFWDHSRHVEGAMEWTLGTDLADIREERLLTMQYDSFGFWDETCRCMEAIGHAEYYRIRDLLRAS